MMRFFSFAALTLALIGTPVNAGVASQAAKAIGRKMAGEATETALRVSARSIAAKAVSVTAKEATEAATRRAISTATQHFGKVFVAQAPKFVDDLALATSRLSSRNNRRLMMMAPKLAESGQAPTVVAKLATGNADELIETLWKHRSRIGSAAAVTTLLVHGDDVVKAGGEFVAKPVIDGTMDHVVAPVSRLFMSGVVLTVLIGMVGLVAYLFGGEATERVTGIVRQLLNLVGRQR